MAERTGLEPATPGVTGRYSNHLNYRSVGQARKFKGFCRWVNRILLDINFRHAAQASRPKA